MSKQNDYVRAKVYHKKRRSSLVRFAFVSGGCVFSLAVLGMGIFSGCSKSVDTGNQPTVKDTNTTNVNSNIEQNSSISEASEVFEKDDIEDYNSLLGAIQKKYVDTSSFDNTQLKEMVKQLTLLETSINCNVLQKSDAIPVVSSTNLFLSGVGDVSDSTSKGYLTSADVIVNRLCDSLSIMKTFEIETPKLSSVGDTAQLKVKISPDSATSSFKYKTSNSSIISVTDTGVLTIEGYGEATITVIADDGQMRTMDFKIEKSDDSGKIKVGSSKPEEVSNWSASNPENKDKVDEVNRASSSESKKKPSSDSKDKPSSNPSSSGNSGSSSKPSSNSGSTLKPSSNSNGGGSSESSKPSHTHSYSKKITKPTCTKEGYTTYTCSCGKSYTDDYKEATGHSWSKWTTTKKATTSSEGKKERTCKSCGKTETKSIAKLKKPNNGGNVSAGEHAITGARKAVYSYRGDHGDKWASVNLVDLLNEERAKRGLCKLEWTADLYYQDYKDGIMTDEEWGSEFIVNGKFDPYNCSEVKNVLNAAQICADRQQAGHGGVSASCVGEIKIEGASVEEHLRRTIQGYLNSPGHYELLMSPGSHRVTATYAIGKDGTVYSAITCGG